MHNIVLTGLIIISKKKEKKESKRKNTFIFFFFFFKCIVILKLPESWWSWRWGEGGDGRLSEDAAAGQGSPPNHLLCQRRDDGGVQHGRRRGGRGVYKARCLHCRHGRARLLTFSSMTRVVCLTNFLHAVRCDITEWHLSKLGSFCILSSNSFHISVFNSHDANQSPRPQGGDHGLFLSNCPCLTCGLGVTLCSLCVAVQNDLGSLFLVPNVENDHVHCFR